MRKRGLVVAVGMLGVIGLGVSGGRYGYGGYRHGGWHGRYLGGGGGSYQETSFFGYGEGPPHQVLMCNRGVADPQSPPPVSPNPPGVGPEFICRYIWK